MRPDHPELLTTLRDVAATAVTLLDAFAQIRRERPPAPLTATTPATPDDPDPPDACADVDDAPDPSPATPPRPMDAAQVFSEAVSQELLESCLRSIDREKRLVQQRAAARQHVASIRERLLEIAALTNAAIEGDDAQTLQLLDARLGQLLVDSCDPFAADLKRGRETDPS
ncbi:MAG: hypothetical protein H0T76_01660 [Nannocystis sp.]|nr:hypothetical protein [Nannocystis sp.]MBA3545169.1 hypothetical protein [Nannocystis sp.]